MRSGLLAAVLVSAVEQGAPLFDRFPASPATRAENGGPARHSNPLSRRYRSALREAARGDADFAGHYVLAQIGCGAACIRLAAIDRSSGRVTWFPATISGWPLDVIEPLSYHLNSRLLIIQGVLDEKGTAARRQFVFDGSRFKGLPDS